MNKSSFLKLLIFLLLFSPLRSAFNQPAKTEWQVLRQPPFAIFFDEPDRKPANQVLQALDSAYPKLLQTIGSPPLKAITVFIASNENIYRKFVGEDFPKWSSGVASPSQNLIYLKSPNMLPDQADHRKIAIHELVHLLLQRATNDFPLPRWFNEGLAVYYSDEDAYASSSLVSKALLTNSIINLTDIDDVLNYHSEKAQLAYQQSYLAVRYLFERFGEPAVKKIISLFGEGKNQDQAFLLAIGMDITAFEYDWYQFIKKKYRWHFLMDFDTYLWIIIVLLFILGFVLMRRRNKKTIERWERESQTNDQV